MCSQHCSPSSGSGRGKTNLTRYKRVAKCASPRHTLAYVFTIQRMSPFESHSCSPMNHFWLRYFTLGRIRPLSARAVSSASPNHSRGPCWPPTEDEATYTAPAHEGPQTFDVLVEDVDISKALKHLHKQTREMLRTHSGMYDGTLGTVHATGHAIITPAKALPIQAQPYRTGKFEMTDHWKSNQHGCKTTGHRTQP